MRVGEIGRGGIWADLKLCFLLIQTYKSLQFTIEWKFTTIKFTILKQVYKLKFTKACSEKNDGLGLSLSFPVRNQTNQRTDNFSFGFYDSIPAIQKFRLPNWLGPGFPKLFQEA